MKRYFMISANPMASSTPGIDVPISFMIPLKDGSSSRSSSALLTDDENSTESSSNVAAGSISLEK